MSQTNILFIVTDQHALSAVSCYGAPVCRTPHIDSLAADGIKFNNAYTPCALCTPARATMLTGLYPHNHGAVYNSHCHLPFDEKTIGSGLKMYPHVLKAAGYRIGYVGKWHAGLAYTAHDVGFEGWAPPDYGNPYAEKEYRDWLKIKGLDRIPRRIPEWDAHEEGIPETVGNGSGYIDAPSRFAPCSFIVDTAGGLLDTYSTQKSPFFLAVNFWGPHAPYTPAEDFRDIYDPDKIAAWPSFSDDLRNRPLIHRMHRHSVFQKAARAGWDEWKKVVARYFEQATMIDAAIGRLLDKLKMLGLYDDTLVVFTADHGETCGIHGGAFDKGAMAYEEVYRVPFVVKLPEKKHAGTVRDQYVSHIDLADTFCAAAGAAMEKTDGASLMPMLYDPATPGREYLVSEFHGHRLPAAQRILWRGNFKYVFNLTDYDELYDLAADPHEMNNLVSGKKHAGVLKELRSKLIEHMKKTGDGLGPEATYFITRPLDP